MSSGSISSAPGLNGVKSTSGMRISDQTMNTHTETAAIGKLTNLILRVRSCLRRGRKARAQRAIRTRFLTRLWRWVRWMISPKQPQSIRGFRT